MTSPVIETAATSSTNTAGTSHVVTLPSGIAANDLILILMNVGTRPTTVTLDAHGDYTELLDEDLSGGLKILYRWADGSETDPTFTSSGSTRDATITYRISGAANPATQAPEIGTTAATTDPPTVTPTGGSKDYLFIAMVGATGEQLDNGSFCTAFPTDYTESQQEKTCGTAGTNLGGMIAAAGFRTTASSGNPSAFTVSDTGNRSQTIAVHPNPDATVAPSMVAAVAVVPTFTTLAAAIVTASAVAGIADLPTPFVEGTGGATDATATPATIEAVAGLPATTLASNQTTAPSTIAAVGNVRDTWSDTAVATTLVGAGDATVTPTTIAAVASVPAPSVLAAAITAPATVAAVSALPAPTIQAQGKPTPNTVGGIAGVGAPTVSGTAIVQPTTVGAIGALPAPTILAGGSVTVEPATVAATASLPTPTVIAGGNAQVSVATIAAIAAVPTLSVLASAQLTPNTVVAIATLPVPTLMGTAVVAVDTVVGLALVPAPTVFGGNAGLPVLDPQAVFLGIEGRAVIEGAEGTAIYQGTEGEAIEEGTEGTARLVEV